MLNILCCLFLVLSYSQPTNQSSTNTTPTPDKIELKIIAYRNQSNQYVVEWRLTDSSGSFPGNNTLRVKTDLSESDSQIILKFQGIYADVSNKVTESLRLIATPEVKTDASVIDVLTTTKPQEITAVPTIPVPIGFEYFPGVGYYKFYPEAGKSYNESRKSCSNDGAHLAIPNSEAEMKVLTDIFARQSDRFGYAYIGYYYQREEGRFVTIFGDAFSQNGYQRWRQGEPHTQPARDCGGMYRDGDLADLICWGSDEVGFFCEYNP